jgi:hypothetical protein
VQSVRKHLGEVDHDAQDRAVLGLGEPNRRHGLEFGVNESAGHTQTPESLPNQFGDSARQFADISGGHQHRQERC